MTRTRQTIFIAFAGAALALLGCVLIVRHEVQTLRGLFETDARIVHRLLSQRAAQHDAVMAMLALMQTGTSTDQPEQRLSSVYPQVRRVERRTEGEPWIDSVLQRAEERSRSERRPVLATVDFARGTYALVQAATPTSHAVHFDLRAMVPWDEWPMSRDTSPVHVSIEHAGARAVLQPGMPDASLGAFEFRKRLAAASQPFDVVASRGVLWSDMPWLPIIGWVLLVTAGIGALLVFERQRSQRRRAEALLRLGQLARLSTLGELTAGMAHELNQPLAAVLASTQAADRLLREPPPDLPTAREAIARATEQARRAANVVSRLRRMVEIPDAQAALQPIELEALVNKVLHLLEPELQAMNVKAVIGSGTTRVAADPIALEQIVHNLLTNALDALAQVDAHERSLRIDVHVADGRAALVVRDSGPGIAAEHLPHLFEPFFTTRKKGLGLGLSLCESLAASMNAKLTAENVTPRGAAFSVQLPLAPVS